MEQLDALNQVAEFHKTFHHPIEPSPVIPAKDRCKLRVSLLREELQELEDAIADGDLVEIADAFGDMMYILYGTICKHGLQDKIAEIFDEIHRSNMSKLGADGKPIYREDGKVMKGENYFKPNIAKYLAEQTEEEHVGN